MGKKSKRRSTKNEDSHHHQSRRLQERRERQLWLTTSEANEDEDEERNDRDTYFKADNLEFFVGDWVWYRDKLRDTIDDPCYLRGIVVQSEGRRWTDEDAEQPPVVSVVPTDVDPGAIETHVQITVAPPRDKHYPDRWDIMHDVYPLALRFDVGDRVVCNTDDGWEAATVTALYAVWRKACYQCEREDPSGDDDDLFIMATGDEDGCIMRRADTLRFQKNEQVIFDSSRAVGFARPRNPPWVEGRVVGCDVVHPHVYAVYEVALQERGQRKVCYVVQDNDQHIARTTTTPRERFLDAIEHDCDYEHFENLVSSYDLDMLLIQDLVLEKSLEHACYGSLLWLQEYAPMDLEGTCSHDGGGGLASRVSRSAKAERYFRKLSALSFTPYNERPEKHIPIELGEVWGSHNTGTPALISLLEDLIGARKVRLLALIFCPFQGLAWELPCISEDSLLKLRDSFRIKGEQDCANLIEMLVRFNRVLGLSKMLSDFLHPSLKDLVVARLFNDTPGFSQESALTRAKLSVRFGRRWFGFHPTFGSHRQAWGIQQLCQVGMLDCVQLFIAADPSLASDEAFCLTKLTKDRGEYLQPELKTEMPDEDDQWVQLCLVDATAHGYCGVSSSNYRFYDKAESYFSYLQSYFFKKSSAPYMDFLEEKIGKRKDEIEELLSYRLWLQSDDDSLNDRLQVLELLVKDHGLNPPSTMDTVRWRQCGVLRWLVEEKLVDLHCPAKLGVSSVDAKTLQVLGGLPIPSNMELGALLCFCCIEFDDLQCLEWLVVEQRFEIEALSLHGWNVGHACAFFGRAEVTVWLQKLGILGPDIVTTPCKRKPNQQAYAVHMAIEKGYIFIAEVLMKAGSPMKDKRGRDFIYYAKRSGHNFVLDFGQSFDKPVELEKNIRELLRIHAADGPRYEKTRTYLLEKQCMAFDRWEECGFVSSIRSGPLGMTFREVLTELCHPEQPELVLWLYITLSDAAKQSKISSHYFWTGGFESKDAGNSFLDTDALRVFAREEGDEKLTTWLSQEWASGIRVETPALLAWFQNNVCHTEPVLTKLRALTAKEVRSNALHRLRENLDYSLQNQLLRGEEHQAIERLIQDLRDIVSELSAVDSLDATSKCYNLVQADGSINADVYLSCQSRTAKRMVRFRFSRPVECSRLFVVLVVEGYDDLLRWLVEKENACNLEQCCEAVNVAAYMGHVGMVQWLLHENSFSSESKMLQAALLGAAEGGHSSVIDSLKTTWTEQLVFPNDPFFTFKSDAGHSADKSSAWMQDSLVLVAVFGCLNLPEQDLDPAVDSKHQFVLKWVLQDQQYDALTFLQVISFCLDYLYRLEGFRSGFALAQWVIEELGAEWWQDTSLLDITRQFIQYMSQPERDDVKDSLQKWLSYLVSIGCDIQAPFGRSQLELELYGTILSKARADQVHALSQFEVLKHQEPLSKVKLAIQDGKLSLNARDKGGLLIVHLAAAYDRTDVLEWLVEELGVSLEATDFQGRDALMIAKASNATDAASWITHHHSVAAVASFVSANWRRKKALLKYQERICAIRTIQPWYRAEVVRRKHRHRLQSKMETSRAFQQLWKETICICDKIIRSAQPNQFNSWEALKEIHCDFLNCSADEDDLISKRRQQQDAAMEKAASLLEDIKTEESGSECEDMDEISDAESLPVDESMASERVYLTKDVLKWLRVADPKYKAFFSRQVTRLAAGERGRKLAKRLIGSQSLIYEAYLEQKAGHRILWTPSDNESLLVWYVVTHDDVPCYMKLIDDSENRSSRQLEDAASVVNAKGDKDQAFGSIALHRVQLDPRSNTPLQLFEVQSEEIERLTEENWTPQLYLTNEEQSIVKTKGTVLVLGRSGTGKTICIGNRMEYDRFLYASNTLFSQLFIARSQRLCKFVKDNVEESPNSDYQTFDELLRLLERTLPDAQGSCRSLFLPSQKVDFQKFKREVCSKSDGVDALIIWSSIRSFIKGSIQAIQQSDRVLSESEYMGLGKRRCRLSTAQRKVVYSVFLRYDRYMKEHNFWDDMDRVMGIIDRLERARSLASPEFGSVRHTKVYVDEVQDYTQAEIYIFFLLSGPGDLFLAGDPCQSVVEGVEFRFEEIRSVGFYICGPERRHLIPEKPKTVNVNFRSHSGILQTAAAVLHCLFDAFPDSAKQLKEDHGLFSGPRPGVFPRLSFQRLQEVVATQKGMAVLTNDATILRTKDALGGYALVYGIREAKGLEFSSVVILNFFSELPRAVQKPWRDLLLGRIDGVDFTTRYPEVEGQLKLLYTALTRCMHRLFFAETRSSIAGDAFVRWLTTCSTTTTRTTNTDSKRRTSALGTRCSVSDVETMQQTPDELRSMGFDNAIMAEVGDDLDAAGGWMEKAIYYFQQAEDIELASKARVYKLSVQYRSLLQNANPEKDTLDHSEVESEVAQLIKSLLIEHLVAEAVLLCRASLPFLPPYSQEQVTEQLLRRLAPPEIE